MKNLVSSSIMLAVCAATGVIGFGLAMVIAPLPENKSDCYVYKVKQKPVTAFVLKPPAAPEAEPKICPEVPKCEAPTIKEPEPEIEQSAPDKIKHRRRRHHRVRAYW